VSGIVVLTGGVGGAKLVHGLLQTVDPTSVTAIVNTGDDFRHLGLNISPDIDTLLYTLSGKANAAQGWGREGESWSFMAALQELGGEDWFNVGDMDLALHVLRTAALTQGRTLSTITAGFARRWQIAATILPMSDDPVATLLDTDEGVLEFQRYFVERRCMPVVQSVRFAGADRAVPAPGVLEAIADADAVLIAPSNPFLSIDPMLAICAIRQALTACRAPVVAVSPLIGGQSIKGPTSKVIGELGLVADNAMIAGRYSDFLNGILIDSGDQCETPEIAVDYTETLMHAIEDKVRVARAALELAVRLR
jgi:LPPG:FO 2-phospho-L-lactate transferase